MNEPTPLQRAVSALGGQTGTAKALEVSAGLVWQWLNGRRPLPAEHCPRLEKLTGVRCEELMPGTVWTRDERGEVTGYHVRVAAA